MSIMTFLELKKLVGDALESVENSVIADRSEYPALIAAILAENLGVRLLDTYTVAFKIQTTCQCPEIRNRIESWCATFPTTADHSESLGNIRISKEQ